MRELQMTISRMPSCRSTKDVMQGQGSSSNSSIAFKPHFLELQAAIRTIPGNRMRKHVKGSSGNGEAKRKSMNVLTTEKHYLWDKDGGDYKGGLDHGEASHCQGWSEISVETSGISDLSLKVGYFFTRSRYTCEQKVKQGTLYAHSYSVGGSHSKMRLGHCGARTGNHRACSTRDRHWKRDYRTYLHVPACLTHHPHWCVIHFLPPGSSEQQRIFHLQR